MTTKEYLGQLKNIDKRIKNNIKEAEKWRSIAMSTKGSPLDDVKVQESKGSDRMAEAIARAVDCERECEELAAGLIEIKKTINEQIDRIENQLYYNLLHGFYVDDKSYSELVVSESYSYRQIRRYFDDAVAEFEKLFGETYNEKSKVA